MFPKKTSEANKSDDKKKCNEYITPLVGKDFIRFRSHECYNFSLYDKIDLHETHVAKQGIERTCHPEL